jgi:hypothetical protein
MSMQRSSKLLAASCCSILMCSCGGDLGGGWTWNWDPVGDTLDDRREDRRADEYERRGADPDRASRMAFEDRVWGEL